MPDYNVHINHAGGGVEITPYFTLPAHELKDVIAPACYSCFDYSNSLADLVVVSLGYWIAVLIVVCGFSLAGGSLAALL